MVTLRIFYAIPDKYNLVTVINQSINQSINQYLLTCKLNSKNAYYKASAKKKKHKNSTNTQTLNKQANKRIQYNSAGEDI
jgi:hypothetical protein